MARAKKPPPSTHDEFVFWVRRPSIYYNFSFQHQRGEDDPYTERMSLTFAVECLYPDRVKGRAADAHFFPDDKLANGSKYRERKPDGPVRVLGSILVGKERFDVGGSLPPEILWRIASAMADGTITSMSMGGNWIKRGHAHITSISFHGPEFDPVAYIG